MIIDGIRDFVYDINSPSEATKIITMLMQWTDERQIHIHAILHQNKGDENTRGHIGTELNNKAETVLLVEKAPPMQCLISMLKCKQMIVQDASKKYIYNPDFVY